MWGVADSEWMECTKCGRYSFVCFMNGMQQTTEPACGCVHSHYDGVCPESEGRES